MAHRRITTTHAAEPQPTLWAEDAKTITNIQEPHKPSSSSSLSLDALRIDHLVMHYLDADSREPVLTDVDADLDETMHAYFAQQIRHAEANAEWRAEFADPSHQVLHICTSLLRGETADFAQVTHQFAYRLFGIMGGRGRFRERISAGDMVVALYHDVDTTVQKLAILKVQPDQERHIREFTQDNGRHIVVFKPATNLLPRVESLQKCAVVWFDADETMPALKLLDKDAGPASSGVAAFFYHDFLGASLGMSSKRRTRLFWSETNNWLNARASAFSPSELMHFYQVRRTALSGDKLDLRRFVSEAVPSRTQDARSFLDILALKLDVRDDNGAFEFEIDPQVARAYIENVVLLMDGKMKLTVSAARFESLVRVADERDAEGKTQLTLSSLIFREVSG